MTAIKSLSRNALPFNAKAWSAKENLPICQNWFRAVSEHTGFYRKFSAFPEWYEQYANCYTYALGDASLLITRVLGVCQPGKFHGPQPFSNDEENFPPWCTSSNIVRMAELDGLECTGDVIKSRRGTRAVVLYVREGQDFHWAREDKDGTWSYKIPNKPIGRTASRNVEALRGSIRSSSSREFTPYKFVAFFNVPAKLSIPMDTIESHAQNLQETDPKFGRFWRSGLKTLNLSGKRRLIVSGCG